MKISIIIPCLNEENTIAKLVKQVQKSIGEINKEIIIIDDGSTDNTFRNLESIVSLDKSIIVETHSSNQGK